MVDKNRAESSYCRFYANAIIKNNIGTLARLRPVGFETI